MRYSVYRYPVEITDVQTISMPEGAQILKVARREGHRVLLGVGSHEQIDMWALVDPDAPLRERRFRVAGTGHPLTNTDQMSYVDTFQVANGQLVFHIFEIDPETADD